MLQGLEGDSVLAFVTDYPVYAITNLQLEQELVRGYAATFGRFNFIDFWGVFYRDYGIGREGFMNTNLIVFLNVLPTLPLVSDGADRSAIRVGWGPTFATPASRR